MSGSSSQKLASIERNKSSIKQKPKTAKIETPLADIKNNAFFKVIFSDSLSLEQKVENVTQILEFTDNKEVDRAKIQEFDTFKE